MKDHSDNSRRRFLQKSLALGLLYPLAENVFANNDNLSKSKSKSIGNKAVHPLKILILGGTGFLGPQQIAYALNRGHAISTFTRGKTKPTTQKDVFNQVEQLTGDRENDLEALRGRKWDLVIDNSGNREKWVMDTVDLLKDNVELYLYTSSTGVYYPYLGKDIREDTTPVLKVPDGITSIQKLEYDYGVMKARNELTVIKGFGKDRSIIVRPTYMIGPGDNTDRFTYWPERLSRGGEVLVPGKANDPVQYIDARDVAGFMIRLAENKKAGVYNAVGPASPTGMHAFIYGAYAAFSSPISFVMIDDHAFLEKHGILDQVPWIMPVGDNAGSALVNNTWSISHGLSFTPLAESVRDIYNWWHSEAVTEERRNRLVSGDRSLMKKEKEVIAEWRNRK